MSNDCMHGASEHSHCATDPMHTTNDHSHIASIHSHGAGNRMHDANDHSHGASGVGHALCRDKLMCLSLCINRICINRTHTRDDGRLPVRPYYNIFYFFPLLSEISIVIFQQFFSINKI